VGSAAILAAGQSISFAQPDDRALSAGPMTVAPTATSGLPITLSSATSTVCTVTDLAITPVSAGTCTIHADQPGNADWTAAPRVTRSFTITKSTQIISGSYQDRVLVTAAPVTVTISALSDGVSDRPGHLVLSAGAVRDLLAAEQDGVDPAVVVGGVLERQGGTLAGANVEQRLPTGRDHLEQVRAFRRCPGIRGIGFRRWVDTVEGHAADRSSLGRSWHHDHGRAESGGADHRNGKARDLELDGFAQRCDGFPGRGAEADRRTLVRALCPAHRIFLEPLRDLFRCPSGHVGAWD
jgi:hypothetical protein